MADIKYNTVPERCTCGRSPIASKVKGGGWIVACPGKTCFYSVGYGATLSQAVDAWNTAIRSLQYKEAQK